MVFAAETRDDSTVEAVPTAGQRSALIQDSHDLLVGVIISQSINLSNDLRRCRPEFPRGQGPGQLKRLGRAGVEANMNRYTGATDERHVSQQQANHTFSLPVRSFRILPQAWK